MPQVKAFMTADVVSVDSENTVGEAAKLMNQYGKTGLIVLTQGKPVGIVTERSILRRFLPKNMKPNEVKVSSVMQKNFLIISANMDVRKAARRMLAVKVSRAVVTEKETVVGFLTLTDIARYVGKSSLIEALLGKKWKEKEEAYICPVCHQGEMRPTYKKGTNIIMRWDCDNPDCKHYE